MMNTLSRLGAGMFLVGGLLGQAHGANLVQNGDFEILAHPDGQVVNSAVVPNWSVLNGNVDFVRSDYWATPNGSMHSLDLSGLATDPNGMTSMATIEQAITISPSQAGLYNLSFYYGANPDAGPLVKFMLWRFGGPTHFETPVSSATPGNANWNFATGNYFLTEGTYYLTFTSLTPGNFGPALDGVSLTAVPEPYHYGMASVLGLMGLVAADRLRNRKLPV